MLAWFKRKLHVSNAADIKPEEVCDETYKERSELLAREREITQRIDALEQYAAMIKERDL